MREVSYTSQPLLQTPRAFLRGLRTDLRVVYHVGWRLFLRNLKVQARQSLLGYAAMLLPPVVAGLVWIFLNRAHIVNVQTSGVPYPVFVLTGIFLWQGFVEALNCPLQQLGASRSTLAKVRVPHEAFVVAGTGVVIFTTMLRLLILFGLMCWFRVPLAGTLVFVPLGLLALLGLGLALGWLVATVGLLYADVSTVLGVGLNLWFLVTPVVYTLPVGSARWLNLNPVTPLLATTRHWLLAGSAAPAPGFWLVCALAGAAFGCNWLIYRLAQPHLIARL